ncbi:MAG TPA: ATP-dependent DNA ligase, partial [Polyangia bacterium]|nr:ATP-dependent DNA ligase [Polyangia bacterium]
MNLPVIPPVLPMLAKRVADIPEGEGWIFEPKWDGFRALIFRDGDEILVQSRDEKSLNRYFPELVEALAAALPPRCVLDGEIVLARGEELDFEMLQQRIHPAASRVKLLAQQIPVSMVFFDLLCDGDRDLRGVPFCERRALLEARLAQAAPPIHVTPATTDRGLAGDWFRRFEGAGLDGVVAKPLSAAYQPNVRAMLKIKHERTADVVLAGYRLHKTSTPDLPLLGSLLLGLYDGQGRLQHVGVSASFTAKRRAELIEELQPLVAEDLS